MQVPRRENTPATQKVLKEIKIACNYGSSSRYFVVGEPAGNMASGIIPSNGIVAGNVLRTQFYKFLNGRTAWVGVYTL